MARNEEAIRRRIEQRIAYVQANPGISKAQAREQYYVQTRAAELEAQGQEVDRAALRQKFRSGQVSREGFYVQGEQERLQSRAARIVNEVTSNTASIPSPGGGQRVVDDVRSSGVTSGITTSGGDAGTRMVGATYTSADQARNAQRQRQERVTAEKFASRYGSVNDAFGTPMQYDKTDWSSRAGVELYRGATYAAKPFVVVGGAAKGAMDELAATFTNPLINRVGGLFGQKPNLREATPGEAAITTAGTLVDIASGGVSAGIRRSLGPVARQAAQPLLTRIGQRIAVEGPAAVAGQGIRSTAGSVANVTGRTRGLRGVTNLGRRITGAVGDIYGNPAVPSPTATVGGRRVATWNSGRRAQVPFGELGPGPTATPPKAPPSWLATPESRQQFIDDVFGKPTTPAATPMPAATPTTGATPGGTASNAIDELRATTQKLIDDANAPQVTPTRGRGGRKPKKTETTTPAASTANDAAQAQVQAGKARLKELKKELAEAKKMDDGDGAAGVVDQIQRDIAKVEADLSKLKTNLGIQPKGAGQATTPANVTSGTVPGRTPAPTPAASTRGSGTGRGSTSRSTTPASETVPPAKTTPAQPETASPARSSGRRSTSRATDDTPRTENVNDEATLDVLWQWAKENAPARKAGTLGPRPSGWKPASQRGVDVALPKNEPVQIQIDTTRAQNLARQEAKSIATQRQASQQFRESERIRAQAGNLRTQQRGSRTRYRNLDERLRALQDDLAARGGADPVIQKRIASLQKQIASERTKRAQVLGQQRTAQTQARQLEAQARGLQEQRLDYVGRPEAGPRMDQTQGRRTATSVAEESRQANTSKWFDDENIRDPYAED